MVIHEPPKGTGTATQETWKTYFCTEHERRAADGKVHKADHWLNDILSTLKRGSGVPDLSSEQREEVNEVFDLVAGLGEHVGIIRKEALVKANGGDFHLFEHLDGVIAPMPKI